MRRAFAGLWLCIAFAACALASEPGTFAVVSRGDTIVFERGEGFADIENDVAITDRTVFRIASLTKQFTAVAVLALIDDKRLSLDDALGRVMPDCPPAWRRITIRQLLNHTSGISGDMAPIFGRVREDFTPDALIAPYRERSIEAKPGARWRYSNVNYWILGRVIERVSGVSYATFVEQRVLKPAALSATREGSSDAIIPRRARGYVKSAGGGWRNAPYFSTTIGYAAGGFVSSPQEMARWYAAVSAGRVISQTTLMAIAADVVSGYGLGWYVERMCGRLVLHHGGSSPGFVAYVYWQPELRLFAGVFKNHDDGGEPMDEALALFKKQLACVSS